MKALAFGEMLWDVYGSERTLGGAPLNVLGHLSLLGCGCSIVSAVGSDELGRMTLSALDGMGISRRYVRLSPYPTGRADVTLTDGHPSYTFNDPAAWDDIILEDEDLDSIASTRYSSFIFGTLASRGSVSGSTLSSILEVINADEIFFDANLRQRFYSREILEKGFSHASTVKMSDEETRPISELMGVTEADLPHFLLDRYGIRRVIVTLGSRGSVCFEGDRVHHAGSAVTTAIDTVGAGDSFSAAFLFSIASGSDVDTAMNRASVLASYVVSHRGAIPPYDDALRESLGL